MATVTKGRTFTSGETVTPAKLNDVVDLATVTNIQTADIADGQVTDAKLSLAANAGEIKKALNADNSPPIFACRAWVNFDGTKDSTGAASTANTNRLIRASGNVASVLRTSAGNYTVTFTTAMSDANYAVVTTQSRTVSGTQTMALIVGITASSFGVGLATTDANVFNDESTVTAAIVR